MMPARPCHILGLLLLVLLFSSLTAGVSGAELVVAEASTEAPPQRMEKARSLMSLGMAGMTKAVSLDLRKIDVVDALKVLAVEGDLNVVASRNVAGAVTLLLQDVSIGEAMEIILASADLAWQAEGNVIHILTNEEYSARQGVGFYDQRETYVHHLQYASAQRLAVLLSNVKTPNGKVVPDEDLGMLVLVDTPAKIAMMKDIIRSAEIPTVSRQVPTESRIFELRYAAMPKVQEEVKASLSKEHGRMHVNEAARTLVVTDLPHQMEKIGNMIEAFDRKPRSVFIEAKIVEVLLTDDFHAGVDWRRVLEMPSSRGPASYNLTPNVTLPLNLTGGITPAKLSFASIGNDRLSGVIEVLQSVTEAKLLSNPHLMVQEGQNAEIKVVNRQPYSEETFGSDDATDSQKAKVFKFVDVGITLNVTPNITDDGFITMKILPEISSIASWYGGLPQSDGAVPVVKTANANTTLTVKDETSIIIAGLIQETHESREDKVPVLGNLPVIGHAFRRTGDTIARKETIIFLTPRIVSGTEPVELLRSREKPLKEIRSSDEVSFPAEKKLKDLK